MNATPNPSSEDARRIVLVTGAAKRIGAAIARHLHAHGFDLALHYGHSEAEMQALRDELEAERPGSTHALQADLEDPARLAPLVEAAVDHFGRLDGLVNNASAFFANPLGQITAEAWDRLSAVNARAPLLLSQAAAPHLRASEGAIVNIADVYAERPRPDLISYAASKAALVAITRGLAAALAPKVRVNAIAPGAILWPSEPPPQAVQAALLARTPLGRTGDPAYVAEAVRWLLDGAGYTTGEVLHVDGGRGIG